MSLDSEQSKLHSVGWNLYHIEGDKALRVVVPEADRECLFKKHMQEHLEAFESSQDPQ